MKPTKLWQLDRIVDWAGGDIREIFAGSEWERLARPAVRSRRSLGFLTRGMDAEVPNEMVVFALERVAQKDVWRFNGHLHSTRPDASAERVSLLEAGRVYGGDALEQMFEGGCIGIPEGL